MDKVDSFVNAKDIFKKLTDSQREEKDNDDNKKKKQTRVKEDKKWTKRPKAATKIRE